MEFWGGGVGGGGEIRAKFQISMRKLHIHIHLDYVRVEFLSCIRWKKKKNQVEEQLMCKDEKQQSNIEKRSSLCARIDVFLSNILVITQKNLG